MHQGKTLYRLQEIDLKLAAHTSRLDEIRHQLADNQAVIEAQELVDKAEIAAKPLRLQQQEIEHQIQTAKNKQNQTEQRLYSGSVTNPKELQDMQHELASLQKWQGELEDRLLDIMVALEEAEETLTSAKDTLAQVLEDVKNENQDLSEEMTAILQEFGKLEEKRGKVSSEIEDATLKQYETMRPQKGNQPLARLTNEGTCSACGIQQTGVITKEIRRGEALIPCINCKRILVFI